MALAMILLHGCGGRGRAAGPPGEIGLKTIFDYSSTTMYTLYIDTHMYILFGSAHQKAAYIWTRALLQHAAFARSTAYQLS
jgi:hypothetical protein